MRAFLLFLLVAINSGTGFCQVPIEAMRESLLEIPIGESLGQVHYSMEPEGFFSPGSPFIDNQGQIVIGSRNNDGPLLIFHNGSSTEYDPFGTQRPISILTSSLASQHGMGLVSGVQFSFLRNVFYIYDFEQKEVNFEADRTTNSYPAPFGSILYSAAGKSGIAITFDVRNPKPEFSIIDQKQLKSWLSTQPGGFSIGDDGLLYRNGVRWSAFPPAGRFIGKLMSGHNLWVGGGISGFEKLVEITNAQGKTELIMTLPWAPADNGTRGYQPFNYGVGPWGEIYYLIAPYWDQENNPNYQLEDGATAELVVVRNHLEEFGRLTDSGVRLRKEPTTTAEILGTYPAKTGFRILSGSSIEEVIAGQKNTWYRVRMLDGKEGWVFGAYVHNLYNGPNGNPPPWPNVPDW